MQLLSDSIYATPQVQALLKHELDALTPVLSGVYGRLGLFIRPHLAAPQLLPNHLLDAMINLYSTGPSDLSGSVSCVANRLPFASESFKLVLLQHASECMEIDDAFTGELTRVLACEGIALIFGFNPWSLWQPWLQIQVKKRANALRSRSSRRWREVLERHEMEVLQVRYVGSLVPGSGIANTQLHAATRLCAWARGAYLVLARKRRITLTPIRPRAIVRPMKIPANLASGTNRAALREQ